MVFLLAALFGAVLLLACFAEVLAAVFLAGADFFAGAAFLAPAFFATAFLAGAFLAGAFFATAFFAGAFFAGAFFAAAFFGATFFDVPAPVLPEDADFLAGAAFEADLDAVLLDPADLPAVLFDAVFEGAEVEAPGRDAAFLDPFAEDGLGARFLAAGAAWEEVLSEEGPPLSWCSSSSRSTESALTSLLKLLFSPSAVVS